MQINRVWSAAFALATVPCADTMASRNGNATVAPRAPRMNVRRGMCFPVMKCIVCLPNAASLKGLPYYC